MRRLFEAGATRTRATTGSVCALVVVLALAAGCGSGTKAAARPRGSESATASTIRPAIRRNLSITKEQASDLPDYNIYRPVDLDALGAPLPVIVWANGGCLRFDGLWKGLLESWAKAGFVVVAITTPAGADFRTIDRASVNDQAKAVDWAYAQSNRPDSPYAGHLDLDRIVAAGNSCGGLTSLTLAARDNRIRSVFVLSGFSVLPGTAKEAAAWIMGRIHVPVGYVIGGPEDMAASTARQDYRLLAAGVPGYLARRSRGTHEKVSTDASVLSEVAEISTNWIDFTLYGSPHVEQTLLENPCRTCAPHTWTVAAKHLDTLVAP